MSSLKKSCLKKGYHCIPFKLTKTNHLVVKVKLNGKKGRFILDTGAPILVLVLIQWFVFLQKQDLLRSRQLELLRQG